MSITLTTKNLTTNPTGVAVTTALKSDSAALETEINRIDSIQVAQIYTITASQTAAANSATAAAASQTAAAASVSGTHSDSTAASTAAANVIAAWQATTLPGETLAAVSKTFLVSTGILHTKIYDTADDSDGGAWRKMCAEKSWYTEAISAGKWLGDYATEADARTAGGVTGDYFHNTTNNQFYSLNVTSGVTQVFRGNRREMPKVILIIVETTRYIIFDLTDATIPMWKVRTFTGKTLRKACAINGKIILASSTGVFIDNYYLDSLPSTESLTTSTTPAIVNNSVNDVDCTIIDGALVHPVTRLPYPYIACATAGGMSILQDTGVVVNSLSVVAAVSCLFSGMNFYWVYYSIRATCLIKNLANNFTQINPNVSPYIGPIISATFQSNGTVQPFATYSATQKISYGVNGLVAIHYGNDVAVIATASITNTYNTGWLVGNSRCCFIGSAAAATDRACYALTLGGGTLSFAQVGTSDRWTFSPATAATATLTASVANGSLAWMENVAGVFNFYTADVDSSGNTLTTGTVNGVAGTPSTSVTVAGGTALTIAAGAVVDMVQATASRISLNMAAKMADNHGDMIYPSSISILQGSSTSVTTLVEDGKTGLTHVGTSWGRTTFKNLIVQSSEATTNGATRWYSAKDNIVIQAGAASAKITALSHPVRDEIARFSELKKTYGKELFPQDFTATASQTTFTLPIGFYPKLAYQNGALKRAASGAGNWSSYFDGFQHNVVLGTGATVSDWISILCTREM